MDRFPRLFSPVEANDLLQELQPIINDMMDGRQRILTIRPDLEPVLDKAVGNGASHETPEALDAFKQVKAAIRSIQGHGVLVKDVNAGLLDFPSEREGRVVFLCWRVGESGVSHWHELDEGFSGRHRL
jgi:hypothetical protein